ncbi:TPA: SAM-dependent methyltransferase [Candidatus Micrarchaeota archaeon]|nr:SAM-dependent methyltransferase [Candidatus Micrarchaeota archaeon]
MCKNKDESVSYYTDGKYLYAERDGESFRLALFDNGFYRLRLWNDITILEVDGLRMQLVKDFDSPLGYSREVAKALKVKPGDSVLDTCMGLGYTAMAAGSKAKSVTTCEYSDAVYTLASWNPFSEELFNNKKYTIMRGDISEKIKELEGDSFEVVVHDPPRFSKAGHLYSEQFYKELWRVAAPDARLYHYVGTVGKRSGRNIENEVEKRLKRAGFRKIRYNRRLQGLLFEL